jgi:adenylate kinase family enzyme
MYNINIIGASGVGKTTLGLTLANHFGIPFFDTDNYYHVPTDPPYQIQRSPEEKSRLLAQDLQYPSWVLGGSVRGWPYYPVYDFSLMVFVYLPPEIRLKRLKAREQQRFGSRLEPGGDMASTHEEFMVWAAGYDTNADIATTLALQEEYLKTLTCPILRLEGVATTDEQLKLVLKTVEKTCKLS